MHGRAPPPDTPGLPSGSTGTIAVPGWLTWDVTDELRQYLEQNLNWHGWVLQDSVETGDIGYVTEFESREHPNHDVRPVLEITYWSP